jgi:hypothetical protein
VKFVPYKRSLPTSWINMRRNSGIVAECDVSFSRGSRIAAKVLFFKNKTDLRKFWDWLRDGHGTKVGGIGKGCEGVVNSLMVQVEDYSKGEDSPRRVFLRGDPRYFCVVGLLTNRLTMEIVTHESVHVGFAYAKRKGRRNLFRGIDPDNPEEEVCYPAGRFAAAVVSYAQRKGFLPK